ncbi:Eco57I restriction-modification methylase domain-containing protein [Porphyromonas levii]|uniref:Eco57I restriction-modification methylase domain-containing protein n=1 Tax=Porphyromonas levii TaxID=28114 RepID=UPI001B8B6072|nr:TaqI-like C-terminal specificity domain-containing protein [Porphyromonas levii]MBR8713640.1 hypothetical protein [Porphyromonas levii]MBR8715621.1 hypothetical protein [Porphyromonas levii]MBR8728195.1 hypothetical protein [Porphyromonas levii]MBR8736549.1 hypothetical protein [Porphyromonas levii]MBR8764144.1 hypothetical protein [Porphyromonas levii]
MNFSTSYNRQDFVAFLRRQFLPEDFIQEETLTNFSTKTTYSTKAFKLGRCESLDLVVYEIHHQSKNDARVGLSKEAFRLLADELEDRALVIFIPNDSNKNYRFSLIEITLEHSENSSKINRSYSNPRRYSYFLGDGIATYTPNKYLNEGGRVIDVEDLRSRFSVEVLTKAFYQELSDWYAWAINIIRFPNNINDPHDDTLFTHEGTIRLITRLIFVWFLKQKKLVPDEFFDEQFISEHLIENFDPHAVVSLFGKSEESKYYKAILQNLFFAMLNSPITSEKDKTKIERRFRNGRSDFNNNKLMRYEDYFIDPEKFVELANNTVPFLNGGLFDCLDDKNEELYYDGFSDRKEVAKSLIVPDYLFFGEEVGKDIDLSEWYGDSKKKKVSARGIIDILKRYNFTIEENTPFDKEVSLDPELLGKVFENLLAAYNPETKTTARKQTGSFYTPREIVQYMVDESLVQYLKQNVGDELEVQYRQLMQFTDEHIELTDAEKHKIIQALYECKVLDPACGSGAFPVGVLQQMVHLLRQLDPENRVWRKMMEDNAIKETSEVFSKTIEAERQELLLDIERNFSERTNQPDYARKLYLIENCIYGVDIQPIAIQISKLRFFISLVVDQKTNNDPKDNFGIRPLPNLEAKFVAANTLVGLSKKAATLFNSSNIKAKEEELKIARHKVFGAKTNTTKKKYSTRVNELRLEIIDLLTENDAIGNEEAKQLASWDMFNQNTSSPFFDSEWMFGIKDGFDIVIGNPPYIDSETMTKNMTKERELYKKLFPKSAKGNWDLYVVFIDKGIQLLNNNGVISYIVPNKLIGATYSNSIREIINSFELISIRDYMNVRVFEAMVYPCVFLVTKKATNTPIIFETMAELTLLDSRRLINRQLVKRDLLWDKFFINKEHLQVILKLSEYKLLAQVHSFHVVGAATVSEAYEIKKALEDNESPYVSDSKLKFINSGTIDAYQSFWGEKQTTYIKGSYTYPVIERSKLEKISNTRLEQSLREKIIVANMTKTIEAFFDKGEYLAGKSTTIILNENSKKIKALCAILNSKLIAFWFKINFNSLKMSGDCINIGPSQLMQLPIPNKKQVHHFQNYINSLFESGDLIKSLDKIDKYVYQIYGLTYDEVLIVDPSTPITEEEYNHTNLDSL